MNPFASKLQALLDEKQFKILDLERFTGINRSTLYKFLNGQREPTGIDVVYQIADCLCLNHLQREELTEAYYLTRMGPLSYYGRKEVIRFYQEISISKDYETSPFLPFASIQLEPKQRIVLNGAQNVNLAIEYFLYMAAQQNKEQESIISENIADDVTLSIIQKIGKLYPEFHCTHLILLDDSIERTVELSHQIYNINILTKLLPLSPRLPHYQVYYRYGNIQAEKNDPAYLPNVVIAGEYVIQYSSNHRYGIVTRDDAVRELYSHLLMENKRISKPFFSSKSQQDWDHLSTMPGIQQQLKAKDSQVYLFIPGIFAYTIIARYGTQDPQIFSALHVNQARMETFLKKNPFMVDSDLYHDPDIFLFFPKTSVDYFAEYGRLSDIPDSWKDQLSVEERITAFQRWILQIHQNNLIMMDFPEISSPVSVFSLTTKDAVSFVRMDENSHSLMTAEVREPSIVYNFYGFWQEREQTRQYSQEETISYIEEKIEELRAEAG